MTDLDDIRERFATAQRLGDRRKPPPVWADIGTLLAELDRRDAILRRLAAVSEPIAESAYSMLDTRVCVLCDEHPDDHAENCPWRQARELLGGSDGELAG